ncbi:MAG TPA: hypothetical protein VMX97_05905 [Hyphomicrobiaceae bacterium]|nr:hypothetical protein [Hyphomicrobiaceae bacterium]
MPEQGQDDFVILDSVTHLEPRHRGKAAHCASHGGLYAGYFAAKMGVGAVILNDAGIGRDSAGVAGVKLLDDLGTPAAAISNRSARIGDGHDGVARGRLSFVNPTAIRLGLKVGQPCREALQILSSATLVASPPPAPLDEARFEEKSAGRDGVKVWVMDSISLVLPEDDGHIVCAASHGALLGGRVETAVKYPCFAVVCNDADRGIDDAGISRLPALDAQGIAGGCVSAFTARIGDGRSLYRDGVISVVNETAASYGGHIGQSCRDFVAAMVDQRLKVGM